MFVECEDCKSRFDVSKSKMVKHKKEFNVKGKSIFLTYYDCPSCGRRHFVQIDDEMSLYKLNKVSSMFIKLSAAHKNEKQIPEKQLAKFKKARKDLSDYRMKLMKEYSGKVIYDNETNIEFVLRFSI